ncbi:Stk1 family PASTA domain-containing Ser/Thr kinase [Loigolactobacillus rennini]|uniref:non-specific serine/threonine protein kinase n=1 Tax=Loigolactobacillus rennini DSM 20253 TaxID=1423796 RepID=A0A0R2D6F2_9LACO|nr:Stk1 family PASTA domain-containing Ser/Thr kinase [Loigolactobacillus rennini]KRM99511.1 serine threonine protein kinase [Loigolactobacillus rennini DSM 20253]
MMEAGYKLDGRYRIIRSIGEGGMANVYLAQDLILNREVAIKVLRLDLQNDPDTIRRFRREELAATELVHPNIVVVYDVGEDNGLQYIVMEYVSGTDLKRYIADHYPIPYAEVVRMMMEVLAAVQQAHAHGIIHRDLKPQNILVDPSGHLKITDFGIAVALSENSITQTNSMLGSVHYLSPEQARGSVATKQSDIYSLGIILYEMLTGKVPFEGETAVSIALKHFQSEIPSVRHIDPNIPQALENVVLRATAKEPSERYQSVAAMTDDLKTALSPLRANEPKFKSKIADEATKVIPKLKPEQYTDTSSAAPASAAVRPASAATNVTKTAPATHTGDQTASLQKPRRRVRSRLRFSALFLLIVFLLVGGGFFVARQLLPVTVPNVRGMTQRQAENALIDANLKVGAATKKADEEVKAGRVVRSQPQAKQKVKRHSVVKMRVSTGKKAYLVKDYTGRYYRSVANQLRQAGFKVKKRRAISHTLGAGEIMAQNLDAGERVHPKGKKIILTVSVGANGFNLRDMTNWPQSSVEEYANSMGFNLDLKYDYSGAVQTGTVMKQSPHAGTAVARDAKITVTISRGNRAGEAAD